MSAATKKVWRLVAPDWHALDNVWGSALPFILWPVGNQPLLAHWMDEAVRRGAQEVELYVADRPAEVRSYLEGGAYWSRRVKLIPVSSQGAVPADAEHLSQLPGESVTETLRDGASLLRHWHRLQRSWLARRGTESVTLETAHPSGGWVGPQARIHPSAKLTAPFWIGANARIGAGCEIGPDALIGDNALVDDGATVRDACVLRGTYVGRNTSLARSAATGSTLLDLDRGCRVEITERFILSAVAAPSRRPPLLQRIAAFACWSALAPFALLASRHGTEHAVTACDGTPMALRTGRTGALWLRRWPWLREIARGNLRWVGVLPRTAQDLEQMPTEVASRVREATPGVFSLADVHGCHDPADAEEWLHALFQAQQPGGEVARTVLKNVWKIAWFRNANAQTS